MFVLHSYALGGGVLRDYDVLLGVVGEYAETGEEGLAV